MKILNGGTWEDIAAVSADTVGTVADSLGYTRDHIPRAQGAACFTFDDAYAAHYDVAVEMHERGQRGTFAIYTTSIDAALRLTTAQIAEMHDMGHEMAFHSYDHTNLTTITAAQRVSTGQYDASALEAIIGEPCTTYVLPQGGGDDTIYRELFLRYDRIAATTGHHFALMGQRHTARIWRNQVDTSAQQQVALEQIRMASKQMWLYPNYIHDIGGAGITMVEMVEMLDLCADLGVPCLTLAEAFPSLQQIPNAGFENGDIAWTKTDSTAGGTMEVVTDTPDTSLGGTKSMHLVSPGTSGEISARSLRVPVTPGESFWLGGRARVNITSGAGTIGIRMVQLASDGTIGTITSLTTTSTSWATLTGTAVALAATTRSVRIDCFINAIQGEAWFDHLYCGPSVEKPVLG